MATLPLMRSLSTKAEQNKKLQRPRPLRTSSSQNRISADFSLQTDHLQELMSLVEAVSQHMLDQNYGEKLTNNILAMSVRLKQNGQQLESIYKDQLDRAFNIFRDGCQNDYIPCVTRLTLLELVELRANHWLDCDKTQFYYSAKMAASENENTATTPDANTTTMPISTPSPPTPPVLGPGEVLKTSGKFSKPTKIPGKNYCKDEVVIRNSDSGKEYMRPVIIKSPIVWNTARYLYPPQFYSRLSPVRMGPPRPNYIVNPGAKERLVQITGPTEDKINHARHLMEDTIRRNASPIREESERERIGDSNSSLNSSASDESGRLPLQGGGSRRSLLHSYSASDANIGEYKYTVTLGHDTVKITGINHDVVRNARLVLEEYYNTWLQRNYTGDCYGLDEDVFLDSAAAPDISMMHLNSLDPVPSLDPGLVYPPLLPLPTPERRATLGRSNSFHLSPLGIERDRTRKYSREFLLSCAVSQLSRATPMHWDSISERFPAIVKKVYNPYYTYDNPYALPPFPPYTFSDGWTYVNPYAFPN